MKNRRRIVQGNVPGTLSSTWLGGAYTNDTGLGGMTVFTGSLHFQVREIEVFEITD
jgi:hypothetical protein